MRIMRDRGGGSYTEAVRVLGGWLVTRRDAPREPGDLEWFDHSLHYDNVVGR